MQKTLTWVLGGVAALIASAWALAVIGFMVVANPSDFMAPLAGGYELWATSAHRVTVVPAGSYGSSAPIIPEKVVALAHDERHIIAMQQHLRRRSSSAADTSMEPDPDRFSYWILELSTPNVLGPFDASDFESARRNAGVDSSLQLRSVSSFRP